MIDALPRFFRSRRKDLHRSFKRPGAVDESGEHNARTDLLLRFNVLFELSKFINRITQVPGRGDTCRDIEKCSIWSEVLVHVPQAGKQRFPGAVDNLGARRRRLTLLGLDADDALTAHSDTLSGKG